MIEITTGLLVILFFVAMTAGFFDAISGGGGLLTVPALLMAGVPPLMALGTNKFQGVFGTATATMTFATKGHLDLRRLLPIAVGCFVASVVGAFTASFIPQDALAYVLPAVLIFVALYFAFAPDLSKGARQPRVSPLILSAVALPFVGLYDGIFGPGAGSFYMLILLGLGGLSVLQATAQTKLFNLASNLGGLIGFALMGAIAWKIGVTMALGQIIGSNLGARMAMKKGAALIRPLLVTICILTALKLLVAG
tara:strand:- start:9771 stop:10526 length:756 start_codon:yes stop_codon:yes gene_type:complete